MRLALASTLLNGSMFRRGIIALAQEKYCAIPTEVGLDYAQLLVASLHFEKRENRFRIVMLVLGIIAVIGLLAQNVLIGGMTILAMVIVQLGKSYKERFVYPAMFNRNTFHQDNELKLFNSNYDGSKYRKDLGAKQNVTIYKDFNPFSIAGVDMGGWSFSIDTTRPSKSLTSDKHVDEFGLYDIYGFMEKSIKSLGMNNVSVTDHFFINGVDIPLFKEILPALYITPNQHFGDKQTAEFQLNADSLRHYKWIQVKDWGNDLVLSFFLRFELKGHNLFVEVSKALLTPISNSYRKIDNYLAPSFANNIFWFSGTILKTPFSFLASVVYSYLNLTQGISNLFGFSDRNAKKQIRNDPLFNYGSGESLRVKMSSDKYSHYFQKMDKELYSKTIEKTILESIIDFLEQHNIDISELRDTQSNIVNSGIIVQGGDVNTNNLAVGKGAKASMSNVVNKVKSKVAA